MMGTMKNVNHASMGGHISSASIDPDFIQALKEMTHAIQLAAERPLGEIRMPMPEFHNEIKVPSAHIDVHVPPVENRVIVEPTPVHVNVMAPDIKNDIRCDFPDLKRVVRSLYVLSGVIGASAMGIATILLWH